MKRTTRHSRHWKAAAKAVANHLGYQPKPVLMYSLTGIADGAAREVGRVTDLFGSLFDYVELLPANWTTAWLGAGGGSGDSLYYATPRGWSRGEVSPSLSATLMGAREVGIVDSPDA